ncbi:transforming growth factor, beta receptor associated protein 1 [Balamuthia mandrillaris]
MLPVSKHEPFRLTLVLNNISGRIASLTSTVERCYVGTTDGHVIVYHLGIQQQSAEESGSNSVGTVIELATGFQAKLEKKAGLGRGKNPVLSLQVFEPLGRLVTLCDGHIDVLNLQTLERVSTISGVKEALCFCSEKNGLHLCAGAKKKLVLYKYNDSHYQFIKEVPLPEAPKQIEWGRGKICVGHKHGYILASVNSGQLEHLPLAFDKHPPLLKRCRRKILLVANLTGTFVDPKGSLATETITWSHTPSSIGWRFPYILAAEEENLVVHSIFGTERSVQTFPFPDVSQRLLTLSDEGSHLLAASPTRIYCLVPVPIQTQVQQLLKELRVEEATTLFVNVMKDDKDFNRKFSSFHQSAGLEYLRNRRFKEAFSEFELSDIDPRELIAFFPDLLPQNAHYTPKNALNVIELVAQPIAGKTTNKPEEATREALEELKGLLTHFLEQRWREWLSKAGIKKRTSPEGVRYEQTLHVVLLKLFADAYPQRVPSLLGEIANHRPLILAAVHGHGSVESCIANSGITSTMLEELESYFQEKKHYNALALVYRNCSMYDKALSIWKSLGNGKLIDKEHDGIEETVSLLRQSTDPDLVFAYSEWVLSRDKRKGSAIFTSAERDTPLPPDRVLEFLSPFGHELRQEYLEHLIWAENNTEELYHNKLALLYLGQVADQVVFPVSAHEKPVLAGTEPGVVGQVRTKLLRLLSDSSHYDVPTMLQRVKDTPLYEEAVIMHSKLAQYNSALMILVQYLRDYERAEAYCLRYHAVDENLFLSLLQIYLSSNQSSSSTSQHSNHIPDNALRLLNRYPMELPPTKVLPLLPPNLPLSQLSEYLRRAFQRTSHLHRDGLILKNLRKLENLNVSYQLVQWRQRSTYLDRETKCPVCKKRIGDVFAYFPNGVMVHFKCAQDKHVCPITGVDFRGASSTAGGRYRRANRPPSHARLSANITAASHRNLKNSSSSSASSSTATAATNIRKDSNFSNFAAGNRATSL